MTLFAVVELEQENNKNKLLADTRVFSSREIGLGFLRRRYDAVKAAADAGAGVLAFEYSEDGWYAITDNDNNTWEGYLSEGLCVNEVMAVAKSPERPATVAVCEPKKSPERVERTDTEILKELMDVVMEYNADRDTEWDFVGKHGIDPDAWTQEQTAEHEGILADIQKNRIRIRDIIREATDDQTIEF